MTHPSAGKLALVAAIAAGAYLYLPTLEWLLRSWRVHPYYGHAPLLPAVAAWLIWQRRDELRTWSERATPGLPRGEAALGLLLVVLSAAIAVYAVPREAHALAAASACGVVMGATLAHSGAGAARLILFPAGLLALSIPLPLAESVAPGLAARVAEASAAMATYIGVPVLRSGAQLSVADGSFSVGAPCSGLRSIIALVTLAYVGVGQMRGPTVPRVLLVAAAVPLALFANWVRLTGLLVLTHQFGAELGLSVFEGPAAAVLFLAVAAVLLALTRPLGLRGA